MRTCTTPLRLQDEDGRACASVPFQSADGRPQLDDLWFMVGSRCNLACIHCYVASSPTNDDLEQLHLDEVAAFLDEAKGFGLRHTYFTGGEPFVNGAIGWMIEKAIELGEVTVLTNGTSPMARHLARLKKLVSRFPGRLHARVSLDHYVEVRHDAIRGPGTFKAALNGIRRLSEIGLRPIVTTTAEVFRGNPVPHEGVERAFRSLLSGVEIDLKILPTVLEMGAQLDRIDAPSPSPFVSEDYMQQVRVRTEDLMCHRGRSVLKRDGQVRVYPCPIIYEAPELELGCTLAESFARPVPLAHPACASYCVRRARGTCTNG